MTGVVVLAGGQGRRMGGNKPFAPFGERTLIEATLERVRPQSEAIAINAGVRGRETLQRLEGLGLPLLYDGEWAELGPLSGVLTAVNWALLQGFTNVITTPCDMPYVPVDMMAQLMAADRGDDVVYFSGVRDYPLCALWSVSVLASLTVALEAARSKGGLAVMRFLATRRVQRIAVADDAAFGNINLP